MLLSAVFVLVVAQPSLEIPEGLMNYPVLYKPITGKITALPLQYLYFFVGAVSDKSPVRTKWNKNI
jgi:hypothetical protein